jgi:uncharacterized protein (TIGR02118 family)
MTIKRITAANENKVNGRTRRQAQAYWAETHGKLVANNPNLKRYHHYFSVPEAYEGDIKPTFMGISMFWRDDPFLVQAFPAPDWSPVGPDDRHVFDRSTRWPTDDQHADILGEENIIIDGAKRPGMINVVVMVTRLPGLDHKDFFAHWGNEHADLAKKIPGLRRYIQNHVVLDMLARGNMTHDGWSEFWFDDYPSFVAAGKSPEWAAMEADGKTMFCEKKDLVIGTEYVQKDESWKPRDYGALSMSEDEIRKRLEAEGYVSLAADPSAPAKIKAAAAAQKLGVWTPHHLVTLDDSHIDARPEKPLQQSDYSHSTYDQHQRIGTPA